MTGNTWITLTICFGLLLTTISADETNECFNEKTGVRLICPEHEICIKDSLGHVKCRLPGYTEPQCVIKDHELHLLSSMEVKEECNDYENVHCPEGKVCCNTSQGHRCVDETDWERIRDDISVA